MNRFTRARAGADRATAGVGEVGPREDFFGQRQHADQRSHSAINTAFSSSSPGRAARQCAHWTGAPMPIHEYARRDCGPVPGPCGSCGHPDGPGSRALH
jgi:hypothetical protein